MKQVTSVALAAAILALWAVQAQGYYGDPPTEKHAWAVHDMNRPRPAVITPGEKGAPPSDAIILFDGKDLSNWEADKPGHQETKWKIANGTLESVAGAGYIRTKKSFGDCQLHIEFATPSKVEGSSQGRGNSGVFLMGMYEIQVLDCYNNDTYPDGQTASVYSQQPPMVNACRPPGEWQVYDIVFRAPKFEDGQLVQDGYVTVFHNGVLVQDHWVLEGPTGHMGRSRLTPHGAKGPLKIQDHGNPVHFRNIWLRELPPKDFAHTGVGEKNEVMAKRAEIAAQVRKEAATMSDTPPLPKIEKLLDAIQYEIHEPTLAQVEKLFVQYMKDLNAVTDKQSKKGEVRHVRSVLLSMRRFKLLPDDFAPIQAIEAFYKEHGLDK